MTHRPQQSSIFYQQGATMAQADKTPKTVKAVNTNPDIQFLQPNGKPVLIPLQVVLNESAMRSRTYALNGAEVFADEQANKKVKGLKHNGQTVISILKQRFGAWLPNACTYQHHPIISTLNSFTMANENKLTPEQMFDYIGINTDNIDDFKTQFDGKFLTRENAINDSEIKSKLTGAMAGGITTHIKRSAKENFGLEISKDEIEGKKVEEIFDLIAATTKNEYETKINDLSGQLKSSPKVDEINAEWESKYNKLKGEFSDTRDLLETTKSEFESKQNEWIENQKQTAIKSKMDGMLAQLDFSDQVNDMTRTGFLTHMATNYQIDLNDSGEMQIKDAEGKMIPNASKHGEFMSPADVYRAEAEKNKMLKVANAQSAKSTNFVTTQSKVDADGLPKRPSRATTNQAF